MTRLIAFGFFVAAAFAVSLPWLDRAGTAAIGFAFLALNVGRTSQGVRPSLFARQVARVQAATNQTAEATFPANADTSPPPDYL